MLSDRVLAREEAELVAENEELKSWLGLDVTAIDEGIEEGRMSSTRGQSRQSWQGDTRSHAGRRPGTRWQSQGAGLWRAGPTLSDATAP